MNDLLPTLAPPRLLVVTIHWNSFDDTSRLLRALQAMDRSAFEVVVVDNGSSDGSLDRLKNEFPGIRFIALPSNMGFGAANNVAVRQAMDRGIPYVFLINNDAVPEPGTFSSAIARLDADPSAGAAGVIVVDDDPAARIQAWGGGRIGRWTGQARHNASPAEPLEFLTGAALLLRTGALQEAGLFDERFFLYWEDVDLCVRLRKAGWRLVVADTRVRHKGSATTGHNEYLRSFHVGRSFVLFVHKHERWPRARSLTAIGFQSLCKILKGNGSAARGFWAGFRDARRLLRRPVAAAQG